MGFIQKLFTKPDLTEDEAALVNLLKQGVTQQKHLLASSGMNPITFNKVLRSLEEKKVAKRIPRGRENTVRLL